MQARALVRLGANACIVGRSAKAQEVAKQIATVRAGAKVLGIGGCDVRKVRSPAGREQGTDRELRKSLPLRSKIYERPRTDAQMNWEASISSCMHIILLVVGRTALTLFISLAPELRVISLHRSTTSVPMLSRRSWILMRWVRSTPSRPLCLTSCEVAALGLSICRQHSTSLGCRYKLTRLRPSRVWILSWQV